MDFLWGFRHSVSLITVFSIWIKKKDSQFKTINAQYLSSGGCVSLSSETMALNPLTAFSLLLSGTLARNTLFKLFVDLKLCKQCKKPIIFGFYSINSHCGGVFLPVQSILYFISEDINRVNYSLILNPGK